jgi:hypothetical protein
VEPNVKGEKRLSSNVTLNADLVPCDKNIGFPVSFCSAKNEA